MTSMNIGISILIPLYNGIEFLEEAIISILTQTYTKWEIIIGINGHEPNSDIEKQVNEIVQKHNQDNIFDIRVIYYNTKGKPDTLNQMINDIKYDYVALLDADDIWLPEKLEKQVPILRSYDVVGTNCQYFGDRQDFPIIPFNNYRVSHNFFIANPIINSSVIIHKNNAKWNKDELLEDYDLWFRLLYERKSFYNLKEVLCKHRIHTSSFFNNNNNNYVNELKQKWLKIIYKNG